MRVHLGGSDFFRQSTGGGVGVINNPCRVGEGAGVI